MTNSMLEDETVIDNQNKRRQTILSAFLGASDIRIPLIGEGQTPLNRY